jgi:hypothetical protein
MIGSEAFRLGVVVRVARDALIGGAPALNDLIVDALRSLDDPTPPREGALRRPMGRRCAALHRHGHKGLTATAGGSKSHRC